MLRKHVRNSLKRLRVCVMISIILFHIPFYLALAVECFMSLCWWINCRIPHTTKRLKNDFPKKFKRNYYYISFNFIFLIPDLFGFNGSLIDFSIKLKYIRKYEKLWRKIIKHFLGDNRQAILTKIFIILNFVYIPFEVRVIVTSMQGNFTLI